MIEDTDKNNHYCTEEVADSREKWSKPELDILKVEETRAFQNFGTDTPPINLS